MNLRGVSSFCPILVRFTKVGCKWCISYFKRVDNSLHRIIVSYFQISIFHVQIVENLTRIPDIIPIKFNFNIEWVITSKDEPVSDDRVISNLSKSIIQPDFPGYGPMCKIINWHFYNKYNISLYTRPQFQQFPLEPGQSTLARECRLYRWDLVCWRVQ